MKEHSDKLADWKDQRMRIIGLGESSIRKSYYPELQRQHAEILKKNEELEAAYQELTTKAEELRRNYLELSRKEQELRQSQHRNNVILDTIPDMLFILSREGNFLDFRAKNENFPAVLPGKIIGKNIRDSGFGRDNSERIMNAVETAIISGQLQISEYETDITQGRRSYEARIVAIDNNEVLCILRDITERKMSAEALNRATRKLNFLNSITFSDIQNAVFSLSGYLEIEKQMVTDERFAAFKETESKIIQSIIYSLQFSKHYQDLGLKPPKWQKIITTFLYGISHVDLSGISRDLSVEGLEVFADPLLENVFFSLAENVVIHGKTATRIRLYCHEEPEGLKLFFEDDGPGIEENKKESIFQRGYERKKGIGLFLTREILGITGITIVETGEPGKGARFEILVPRDYYRFTKESSPVQ